MFIIKSVCSISEHILCLSMLELLWYSTCSDENAYHYMFSCLCQGVLGAIMRRKVAQQTIQQWRRLTAEGGSLREVSLATGWDPRTVAKYLEEDIHSTEATRIRQDLFKERLGQHWDMLIDNVTDDLAQIKVPGTRDLLAQLSSWSAGEFPVPGGIVILDVEGAVRVDANARKRREWQLLQEHLLQDPIWRSVREWEEVMAQDLEARRPLYLVVEEFLTQNIGWPVRREADGSREPIVNPEGIYSLYEEAFARAIGLERPDWEPDMFYEENGWARHRGTGKAWAPGKIDRVNRVMLDGQQALSNTQEAVRAAQAYQRNQKATNSLHETWQDIKLLRYLPRVCSVCGRVEGI